MSVRTRRRSLDLMYYTWHDDLTGRLLANEVVEAADRGVRVRLLLDDINTHGNDAAYVALDNRPNIAVRLFNPSRARTDALRRSIEMALRAVYATRRMHNKAPIADGRLAIVGGRNIGDEYFDAARSSSFRDLDILLVGPEVTEPEAVFDAFWNSDATLPIAVVADVGKPPPTDGGTSFLRAAMTAGRNPISIAFANGCLRQERARNRSQKV